MKLKEFSIMRYGPLPNTGKIEMGNFNLLFGKNEDGKTLTIDALVRFLLGKNVKDFEDINRVNENPEGYAVLEEDGGNEIKLPEKGDLTNFADLTPSECRNIFIIRDSDLSISSESDFYTSITDRLIGLRTNELSKIRDNLLDLGKLTPGFTIRDKKGEKLKTNIDRAEKLIQYIEPILGQMEEEGFENLENDYVHHLECINQIKSQIDSLED
ncbi:MAG: AAA family ATPase, partial [Thermoplasmatales archaeon]|nr:AAA family ATPase [Thermoplasmatales archaeon]